MRTILAAAVIGTVCAWQAAPSQAMVNLKTIGASTTPTVSVITQGMSLNHSHGLVIPVSEFRTQCEGTAVNLVQGAWRTGTVTPDNEVNAAMPARLFRATRVTSYGSDRNSVGRNAFLQLDLSRLERMRHRSVKLLLTTTYPGSGYALWASNQKGVPGYLVMSGAITTATARTGVQVPDCGSLRYLSVSSTTGKVRLISVITTDQFGIRPVSMNPVSVAAFGMAMGLTSMTFLRRRNSLRSPFHG